MEPPRLWPLGIYGAVVSERQVAYVIRAKSTSTVYGLFSKSKMGVYNFLAVVYLDDV